MGVNGLWQLLSPVARPIALETLGGRRLAIDASIWMYQFQMAMRDRKTGDPLQGAHIMGTFRRIMKLLYHGIKPVFVFDGDAPMLKKRTIAERKRRKAGATRDLAKTAQQLLSAQLRQAAAENALKKRKVKGKEKAQPAEYDTGEQIDPNAVYLDDVDPDSPRKRPSSLPNPSPLKKFVPKDAYALPTLEGSLESRAKASDSRIATDAEIRDFFDGMRPEDFDADSNFIDSDFFANLPTEVKYEIIGDLRIKSRQVNHRRVDEMRTLGTALDFSRAQIKNLMQRNTLTQKLFSVTDAMGQSTIAIPTRVAGERNREYLLVKQDADKGGGWVLGVKDPKLHNNEQITIDTTSDESSNGQGTDSDDFEEVRIPKAKRARSPSLDPEVRRTLAMEAIRARYAPEVAPTLDPYLDQPTIRRQGSLFKSNRRSRVELEEEMDPELQEALMESAAMAKAPLQMEEDPELREALEESALLAQLASAVGDYDAGTLEASGLNAVASGSGSRPAVDDGGESDSSLEYGNLSSRATSPKPVPSKVSLQELDSDDSDAFEEVDPVAVSRLATATSNQPTLAARPRIIPPPAILQRPSPLPSHASTRPLPPSDSLPPNVSSPPPTHDSPPLEPAPYRSSLMDTLLPSDSDSDSDVEVVEPAPLPPLSQCPIPRQQLPAPVPISNGEPARISPTSLASPRRESAEDDVDFGDDDLPVFSVRNAARNLGLESNVPSNYLRDGTPKPKPSTPEPLLEMAPERLPSPKRALSPKPLPPVESPPAPKRSPSPEALPSPQLSQHELEAQPQQKVDEFDSDEEVFEWENSPTPPARDFKQAPLFQPAPEDDEIDYAAEEEIEAMRNLDREQEQYADMMSQLKNRRLDDMHKEAREDVAKLTAKKNAEQRNADGVTRQMASDIKDLLELFGLPYVDAPQEAEAECAELLSRHLVDGIVTDDSDVFLFGGSRIYRNMFNDNKYVECYLLSDLEKELGLDRGKLVRLAYLLGGDYADGLQGVGPVLGRELLEEFSGEDGLQRFKEWWMKVQSGRDDEEDTKTAWRRKFKKGHKNLFIDSAWPNPAIAQAYYKPAVNKEDEPFSWSGPDLDGLRTYLNTTLTWSSSKTDELMLPLIKRQNQRKGGQLPQQQSLSNYFDVSAGNGPLPPREQRVGYASSRLQNVVQSWRKKQKYGEGADELSSADEDVLLPPPAKRVRKTAAKGKAKPVTPIANSGSDDEAPAPKKTRKPRAKAASRKGPAKSTAASRKKAAKEARDRRAEENGGVYSSEEDFGEVRVREKAPKRRATKRPVVEEGSESGGEGGGKRRRVVESEE